MCDVGRGKIGIKFRARILRRKHVQCGSRQHRHWRNVDTKPRRPETIRGPRAIAVKTQFVVGTELQFGRVKYELELVVEGSGPGPDDGGGVQGGCVYFAIESVGLALVGRC